jgi:hypothetical protein
MVPKYVLTIERSTNSLGDREVWGTVRPECGDLDRLLLELQGTPDAILELIDKGKEYCGDIKFLTETVVVSFEAHEEVYLLEIDLFDSNREFTPTAVIRDNFCDLLSHWLSEVERALSNR